MLNQLMIEHNAIVKEKNGNSEIAIKKVSDQDHEIIELSDEIENLEKELETMNDRKKKIHLVSDQVGGWANRVVSKLNI